MSWRPAVSVVVRMSHSVLARILGDAVKDRVLAANPARGVKLPPVVQRQNVYLTATQFHALAHEAGRYHSLVLLLGTAGLRWSEVAALRPSDVDFLRRRVNLHRNAVTLTGEVAVGTLKSVRPAPCRWPRSSPTSWRPAVVGKDRDELIWGSGTGGYLPPPGPTRSWLSGAVARCRKADPTFPRISAHALRHTAASLAISAGANVKVVQRMLGHSSAAMTLDVYADLFDDDLTGVADRLQETVGKMWARGS